MSATENQQACRRGAWADIDSTSDVICAAYVRVDGAEVILAGAKNTFPVVSTLLEVAVFCTRYLGNNYVEKHKDLTEKCEISSLWFLGSFTKHVCYRISLVSSVWPFRELDHGILSTDVSRSWQIGKNRWPETPEAPTLPSNRLQLFLLFMHMHLSS
jgi:hypothetical protein